MVHNTHASQDWYEWEFILLELILLELILFKLKNKKNNLKYFILMYVLNVPYNVYYILSSKILLIFISKSLEKAA